MPRRRSQLGISLVEVLVGVGIGIIGALAIFQTVTIWNRHVQTTSAGGDAQVAGALALFSIERDFKQSGHGFGLAPVPVMGCMVEATDTTGRGNFQFPFQPIDIVVGAAGAPDLINVLFGSSSFSVEGQDFLASTATAKTLRRRGGFRLGDLVVVADAGAGIPGSANCRLAEVTSDANPDLLTIDHTQVSYASFYKGAGTPSRFNSPAGIAFPYVSGQVFNLGPQPQLVSWQVGGAGINTLERSEFVFDAPAAPMADGVVNLKAEYGVDINGNTRIDPTEWRAVMPVGATWNQVLAIRVALLVRSRQFERSGDSAAGAPSPVTTVAPTYFGTPTSAPADCTVTPCPFTMRNTNGAADAFAGTPTTFDPNNWRYYRYRVYERVIPLKNMLWAVP